jgi:putative ABC transport system substrate-binding protein
MNHSRREFIMLLGSAAAAWPLAARAQQGARMRRIAVLMNAAANDPEYKSLPAVFSEGLRQLGWIEGQNVRLEVRWTAGDVGVARIYAAQIIGLMPDVVLAHNTINVAVMQQATNAVPVVFLGVSDPVAQGFVASVTQPGGNLTGFSAYEFSIGGKWLGLLKEAVPSLERAAVMFNPEEAPQSKFFVQAAEEAGRSRGVQVTTLPVLTAPDTESSLASFGRQPNGGVILPPSTFMSSHASLIAELAARYRLPSIAAQSPFAMAGALMEYGTSVDLAGQFRQAAGYVDRILKGAKPGDLPIQGRTRYTFVINLKTAKALGIEFPPGVFAIADEVIE